MEHTLHDRGFAAHMAAIYAIGSNGSGQLGIGHEEDVSVPKEVLFEADVIKSGPTIIRAGGNHTLLLSASKQLYCSGDLASGAGGLMSGSEQRISKFRPVGFNAKDEGDPEHWKVTHCGATWEASIVVTEDKQGFATQVYSFGIGNKGELGQGEMVFRTSKAQRIKDFPPVDTKIVDLAACVTHVIVVLSNGDVYGWGNGRKGQLGQPEEIVYNPRRVSGIPFKVARAVCGREFTYITGAPEGGEHMILGSDKSGVRSSAPQMIRGWRDVGATWGSLFVLQGNGQLLSWGRSDHGQLPTAKLPKLSQFSTGSEHVVGLTNVGDVIAWGWGEHGNCGPSTTDGDVKDGWNVIASSQYLPAECKIASVGAGCATSWIAIASQDSS